MHFTLSNVDLSMHAPVSSKERESALKAIQAILGRRGYSTMRDGKVEGISGAEHHFEILAKGTSGENRELIMVHPLDQRTGVPSLWTTR